VGIDWDGVKKDYESGTESQRKLAEKYGCNSASIRRKARKDGWERKKAVRASAPFEREALALPGSHRSFWLGVEKKLASGLKTKDLKKGLEELKVAKMAGEVISGMIRSKRLELGIEEAGAEKGIDEAGEIAGEMARVTASSGTEEAVD